MAIETDSLESLCELIVDCPHSTPKWTDHGVVVLRNQNIRNGTLDLSDPSFTNEEDYQKRIKRAVPQAGDIVFTREAPMGEVCLVPDDLKCCLGQRQVLLRPRKDVSGEYLFWALQSPVVQHQISWNEGTGTTVSNVRIPVLKSLQIPRHPQDEAKAASMLSALANKIQLNRQTNQTLEAMAQALFKSWFVDFDPVIDNALAAGHEIPPELQARAEARKSLQARAEQRKASLSGDRSEQESGDILPESIRQLFPNRFVLDAQMGWIPEGWEYVAAHKVTDVAIGKTPPRKQSEWFSEERLENLVWVSIKDMGGAGCFIGDSSEYLTAKAVEQFNIKVVPKNSVILSFKLTLGRVCIAQCDLTTNEAIAHFVNPRNGLSKEFLYCYLKSFDYNKLGSTSSIATAVNSKIIKDMPILVPSETVSAAFVNSTEMLFSKLSATGLGSKSLAKLRDTLLPKLISGELRLPESTSAAPQQETAAA